jgi:hypothetical protein
MLRLIAGTAYVFFGSLFIGIPVPVLDASTLNCVSAFSVMIGTKMLLTGLGPAAVPKLAVREQVRVPSPRPPAVASGKRSPMRESVKEAAAAGHGFTEPTTKKRV